MTIQIEPIDSRNIANAVEILVVAFEQDPMMSYFYGDRYQSVARPTMQYLCDRALLFDLVLLGVFLSGELRGVAIITPPEVVERETLELDEQLAIAVGEDVISKLEAHTRAKKARQPQQPHFYLDILGVLPESRGQGIGRALLTAIHEMSETSSYGVALDTAKPSNVDLYRHFGYSVTAGDNLEQTKVWFMFRPNSL